MYLVIKTSQERIDATGSLFEAARGHWRLDPEHASECTHAVVTLLGSKDVKAVYNIDKWYPSTVLDDRYVFSGDIDDKLASQLVGRTLNSRLTARGLENPVLYVEEDELLEV